MQSVKTDKNYTLLPRGTDKSDREFTAEQMLSNGGCAGEGRRAVGLLWVLAMFWFVTGVCRCMGFPGGSVVKNFPTVWERQETRVQSLGQKDLLEEEMATHSSILTWRSPWTEEPGRLQSIGSQRVRHIWVAEHTHIVAWVKQCILYIYIFKTLIF